MSKATYLLCIMINNTTLSCHSREVCYSWREHIAWLWSVTFLTPVCWQKRSRSELLMCYYGFFGSGSKRIPSVKLWQRPQHGTSFTLPVLQVRLFLAVTQKGLKDRDYITVLDHGKQTQTHKEGKKRANTNTSYTQISAPSLHQLHIRDVQI